MYELIWCEYNYFVAIIFEITELCMDDHLVEDSEQHLVPYDGFITECLQMNSREGK